MECADGQGPGPWTDRARAEVFLRKAKLDTPFDVPPLKAWPTTDFESSLPDHANRARALLVQHRVTSPSYRPPAQQKRNLFRTKKRREAASDGTSWIFTTYEAACIFDTLIISQPRCPPGISQAILSHASVSSLDELWSCLHDPKNTKSVSKHVDGTPNITWLDHAASQDDVDYVRLMCQAGLYQQALDGAFGIALARHSMDVMEMLLSFGACASSYKTQIRELFKHGDNAVARLLLSAHPGAMSLSAWRHCLAEEVADSRKIPPSILLMCLNNRRSIACPSLLLDALKSQNFHSSAAILAYANPESRLAGASLAACGLVSDVDDADYRYDFFTLLADSGLLKDSETTRKELMVDVKIRHLPLVRLLADAGVAVDLGPYNAVAYAISTMDLELLDCFRGCDVHTPVALIVDMVPESLSELQLLRLVDTLMQRGLPAKPVNALLVRAARRRYTRLAERLLWIGASVQHEGASAIHTAIVNEDFDMLSILLTGFCSAIILSAMVPVAMALESKSSRRQAMIALVGKGVLGQCLGVPLQNLVAEEGDVDSALVQVLLKYGAPVESVGDDDTNAILQAARKCDVSVLAMLCSAGPSSTMLSKAVQIAFKARHTSGYEAALGTIILLLTRGAKGPLVDQLLVSAVIEDLELGILRTLVEHGAEANFANGAAFEAALSINNHKPLEILCSRCPPKGEILDRVLHTAIDPIHYSLPNLELLLRSTHSVGAALDAFWCSNKIGENPHVKSIITCFLRHGMNVDHREASFLCFALEELDIEFLIKVLSWGPNLESLTKAFRKAADVKPRELSIKAMSLILETAQSKEIGQSEELVQQTYIAFDGDSAGLTLLLDHMANIDFDNGAALSAAIISGRVSLLNYMVKRKPAVSTLHRACLTTAASETLSSDQKQRIFDILLGARDSEMTKTEHASELLADCVTEFPNHTQLPLLLLKYRVDIQFGTLKVAMQTSTRDLFKALIDRQNVSTVTDIFRVAADVLNRHGRRYWIYESLLSLGVAHKDISEALISSLHERELGDLELPKLLLKHGADVSFAKCAAFDCALQANSFTTVQLLSQYIFDDHTACYAFDLARKSTTLSADVRSEVYSCLLQWNINATSIYDALVGAVEYDHIDERIVRLLLAKHADPNQEFGRCFVMAARASANLVFQLLAKYANCSVVFKALMKEFRDEQEVLLWFTMCLEQQPRSIKFDEQDQLFQCMWRFPTGSRLLKVLLRHGVSPATLKKHALATTCEPEECTLLIRALLYIPNISNDTILTLLHHGPQKALPTYATPEIGVTAAFACLLNKARTPVLKALLGMNEGAIQVCHIPAATFRYFGRGGKDTSQVDEDMLPARIPIREACLFLGNLRAYKALGRDEIPNDGTLHTVALMAMPKFVQWLLQYHDANAKVVEQFDTMIPLALACNAAKFSWCKIANEEAKFATRRRECILLLGPKTNLKWRYRQKSILHIALENGPEVTDAMLEALDVRNDPKREERYLYKDKDGIEYSPDEYVRRIMQEPTSTDKAHLLLLLEGSKIEPRYFRSVMPGEGEQPAGYCGLPPKYADAWRMNEANLYRLNRRRTPQPTDSIISIGEKRSYDKKRAIRVDVAHRSLS
ncbi:hypothetical protein CC86DRAFT_327483 [Ophiobolus disseminans]|uniref:Uncharacterized protein n=1 Tax=Ophiobolus disseminans TaxID=1469910 RepID=A0A6A6ZRG8_9PLEO|nr:hypothetical protein CC86DRAFT_327483 [Ophiobolus disseminans]